MFWWLPLIVAATASLLAGTACAGKKSSPPPKSSGKSQAVKPRTNPPDLIVNPSHSTSSYLFALSFLRASSGHDENFVFSPFSLGAALAIVMSGANGKTQEELISLLGMTLSTAEISSLYASLNAVLSQKSEAVTTHIANGLFVDKEFPLKSDYQSHVEKAFTARAENLDFKDGDAASRLVNSFVNESTKGMISRFVDSDSFANASAIIINAIYFKGTWATPFKDYLTESQDFHGISGNRQEPFMRAFNLSVQYSTSSSLSAVRLYYEDPAFSLLVLMPSGGFGEWRAILTADSLHAIISNLETGEVDLSLPKFKFESTIDAKEALQKCGVKRIFGLGADLSGISDENLFISSIVHTAFIECSEEGTEAAAVTFAELRLCAKLAEPQKITFDRPFLYLVMKEKEILFVGQMV